MKLPVSSSPADVSLARIEASFGVLCMRIGAEVTVRGAPSSVAAAKEFLARLSRSLQVRLAAHCSATIMKSGSENSDFQITTEHVATSGSGIVETGPRVHRGHYPAVLITCP